MVDFSYDPGSSLYRVNNTNSQWVKLDLKIAIICKYEDN